MADPMKSGGPPPVSAPALTSTEDALKGPEYMPVYANLVRDFAPWFEGDDQRGLKRRDPPPMPPVIQGGNWVLPPEQSP